MGSFQALYFSPTGGTRKIVSEISKTIGLREQPEIDLTLRKSREEFKGKVSGDLIIIGSPVYAGTIPYPFLESLKLLNGKGKWAIPIAVYGNRSADSMIEEMAKVLKERGFKILAAASFISKHSYAVQEHPWGIGRPDEKDYAIAVEFGHNVTRKAKSQPNEISLSLKLSARGFGFADPFPNDQVVDDLPEGYHKRVIDRMKWIWMIDSSDKGACNKCGKCTDSCPTGAIDDQTLERNDDLCIRCMACVENCPSGALKLVYSDKPMAVDLFAGLDKAMASRKEPRMYV